MGCPLFDRRPAGGGRVPHDVLDLVRGIAAESAPLDPGPYWKSAGAVDTNSLAGIRLFDSVAGHRALAIVLAEESECRFRVEEPQ